VTREAHPRFGFEFDWLAVDRRGHLALMISEGYGPVPLAVLDHPDEVDAAVDALAGALPVLRDASPPANAPWMAASCEAQARGLYVYEWDLYDGPYERLLVPGVAVTVDALPPLIGAVARFGPLDLEFTHAGAIRFPYVDVHTL
jgi:hypothetical protein